MTIGQRIQLARKDAKLTQSKLGSKMGVTNRCISMWERDLRKPKYETLERIAAVLGISVTKLLPNEPFRQDENIKKVVLCKDCAFSHPNRGRHQCKHPRGIRDPWPNDFCSYGTKRSNPDTRR